MVCHFHLAVLLAGLWSGGLALRVSIRDQEPETRHHQRLENRRNVQYLAKVKVGGQEVEAILDTGSFDVLVSSVRCAQCRDPPYNPNTSSSFRPAPEGTRPEVHTFGSGPVRSMRGYEEVELGDCVVENQTFFQILEHNISAMNESGAFNAIVGLGPQDNSSGSAPSLLTNLGVTEFSVCLERATAAPGWLSWGGQPWHQDQLELRVVGKRHWAVPLRRVLPELPLSPEQRAAAGTLLCGTGCAAVLDSGTSLLAAPSHALRGLELLLPPLQGDCSNFAELPELRLELDGYTLRLPPEAYVMRLSGSFSEATALWERLHIRPNLTAKDQCFYALLPMDAHTDFGPLWVLGMPFFRVFHVTFGLAAQAEDRRVWLRAATDSCEPLPLQANVTRDTEESPLYHGVGVHPHVVVLQGQGARRRAGPLVVDPDSLRLPKLMQSL